MKSFVHERGPQPTREDDGIIRATYGPVEIIANLGPQPRIVAGHAVPPFGFRATAPGVIAASLQNDSTSFVVEGNQSRADVWVYAAADSDAEVELPARMSDTLTLTFDNAPAAPAQAAGRVIRFRLPARSGVRDVKFLWHAVVTPR